MSPQAAMDPVAWSDHRHSVSVCRPWAFCRKDMVWDPPAVQTCLGWCGV